MSTINKTLMSPLFLLMLVVSILGIIIGVVAEHRNVDISTNQTYTKEELFKINENIARYALQCIDSLKNSSYPPSSITERCEKSARSIYLED